MLSDLVTSLFGIQCKIIISHMYKFMYIQVYTALFVIIQMWIRPKCTVWELVKEIMIHLCNGILEI